MATSVGVRKLTVVLEDASRLSEECEGASVLGVELVTSVQAERDSFANAFYTNSVRGSVGDFASCGTPRVRTGRKSELNPQGGFSLYIFTYPLAALVMMFFLLILFCIPQLLFAVGKEAMQEGKAVVRPPTRASGAEPRRATLNPDYRGTPDPNAPRAKLANMLAQK